MKSYALFLNLCLAFLLLNQVYAGNNAEAQDSFLLSEMIEESDIRHHNRPARYDCPICISNPPTASEITSCKSSCRRAGSNEADCLPSSSGRYACICPSCSGNPPSSNRMTACRTWCQHQGSMNGECLYDQLTNKYACSCMNTPPPQK